MPNLCWCPLRRSATLSLLALSQRSMGRSKPSPDNSATVEMDIGRRIGEAASQRADVALSAAVET